MKLILQLALAILAGAAPLYAGENTEAVKKDLKQAATHAKAAVGESREEFTRRLNELRVDFHKKIRGLERKARSSDRSVRRAVNKKLRTFKKKERELSDRLDELKQENKERWTILKDGIEAAADELKEAYDDVAETLK